MQNRFVCHFHVVICQVIHDFRYIYAWSSAANVQRATVDREDATPEMDEDGIEVWGGLWYNIRDIRGFIFPSNCILCTWILFLYHSVNQSFNATTSTNAHDGFCGVNGMIYVNVALNFWYRMFIRWGGIRWVIIAGSTTATILEQCLYAARCRLS